MKHAQEGRFRGKIRQLLLNNTKGQLKTYLGQGFSVNLFCFLSTASSMAFTAATRFLRIKKATCAPSLQHSALSPPEESGPAPTYGHRTLMRTEPRSLRSWNLG